MNARFFLLNLVFLISIGTQAKKFLLIYPNSNSMNTVIGHHTWGYYFQPYDKYGQAFRFSTVALSDTAHWQESFPPAKYPNPNPQILTLIKKWDVNTLDSIYKSKKKKLLKEDFSKVLTFAFGKDFSEQKAKQSPRPMHTALYMDNLTPYTYKGVRCMLLWDDATKCVELGDADKSIYLTTYDFDYTLKDAEQIALCKYAEDCYIVLLLTNRIIEE